MPGIGKKSAQRIALHLLQKRTHDAQLLADQLSFCLEHLHTCSTCRNLCEATNAQCSLCMDTKRRTDILCVTETLADVISIEQTTAFTGTYFILHGKLSPIDRVGPEQLGIEQLLSRIQQEPIEEIILATSSTLEGNSTAEYIAETLSETSVRISRLATGIPLGTDFEYINQHTLFQALSKRTHWK